MNPEYIEMVKLSLCCGVILLFVLAIRRGWKKAVDGYRNLKLRLNLIPATATENLRTRYPEKWEQIRSACIRSAGNSCEICKAKFVETHCHEEWKFYEGVQRLLKLQCLCKFCHQAKHIGYALSHQGQRGVEPYEKLIYHLARVNRQSTEYIQRYVDLRLDEVAALAKKYPHWTVITEDFPSRRQRFRAGQRAWE
jgi:hypothetical protein